MLKLNIRQAIALLLIGVALVFAGAYMIFRPAAIILAGVLVIAFVFYRVDVDLERRQ